MLSLETSLRKKNRKLSPGGFPWRLRAPTVKRRRLAAELRQRRLEAKLTIEQVAERLEWSPGKISKIENARVSVLPRDVRHLLREYGIEGAEREHCSPSLGSLGNVAGGSSTAMPSRPGSTPM